MEARGDLHWLEWSLPEDEELDDTGAVARCNPAPWITPRTWAGSVPPSRMAVAQFHACRWGVGDGSWLPAGASQVAVNPPPFRVETADR